MKRILRPLLMAALLVAGIHVFAQNHTYVDLGLPSGTLWATCNVGANKPEEYGDHFAWGETKTKTRYEENNYKYCNGSIMFNLTKYCCEPVAGHNGYTDNFTVLLPSDDAATANWGGGWCTPTVDQWDELFQNTTAYWTTTRNGVNGLLLSASNGNSIFLPAAGYRSDDELSTVGSHGYYWSSSLMTDVPEIAWGCDLCDHYYEFTDYSQRCWGMSIRPVRSSR